MKNNHEPLNQSDPIDQGTQCAQFFTDIALQLAAESFHDVDMDSGGICLNCGMESINRFCDHECRDEYQEHDLKSRRLLINEGK